MYIFLPKRQISYLEKKLKMSDLSLSDWSTRLGLFPMPLFQNKFTDEKFILLNGSITGNLCLDLNNDNASEIRNLAWSSNVGHYLVNDKNSINVYRWDNLRIEKFSKDSVSSNIEAFYGYLRTQEFNKQESIVKFIIYLFRQIRTIVRDENGNESLNSLLLLLACASEGNFVRNNISIGDWGIKSDSLNASIANINDSNWSELAELLVSGLKTKGLKPDIQLILRHAAGSLFQEAHYESIFPVVYQSLLPGFLPQVQDFRKNDKEQTTAHFTPTSIVRTIVEESINAFIKRNDFCHEKELTVFDPACGSGEFLKEFIRQIKLKGHTGKINVIGWDISRTAIDMANFIVTFESKAWNYNFKIDITVKDALQTPWDVKADFLLMNPPFISWELMNADLRSDVSKILGELAQKKPNTAGAFFWNAVNCLSPNGAIGCVLPASIFDTETSIPLREEVKKIINVEIIGRLGSHTLFSEALVDTTIFIGINENTDTQAPIVLWSDFKTESNSTSLRELRKLSKSKDSEIIDRIGYSLYRNPALLTGKNWMPIPHKSFEILSKYDRFTKVEDIFNIRQGVRTGFNSAFLVPKSFYARLKKSEKGYFRPAITNDSIANSVLNDNYYIFYAEGDYSIKNEDELKKVAPTFYSNYLLPNIERLSTRARKGLHNYWRLSEHRDWQIPYTQKLVSKEFGKAGDFAFDKTGEFVCERSHAWLLKNDKVLNELGYAYICILNMPIINDFLSGLSKQIGGGQWYLSSQFINKMPLPNLFDEQRYSVELRDELIQVGIQITQGVKDTESLERLSNIVFNV